MGIIGDVEGLDVLEIGGGQNSIVLKKQGARNVTGIDQSEKQLKYARELAERVEVEVRFLRCDMEDLSEFDDGSFNLIVSSHAMNYASNTDSVFRDCIRLLRTG